MVDKMEAMIADALEPFAKAADECDGAPDDMAIGDASYEEVTVGHCRQARAILASIAKENEGG